MPLPSIMTVVLVNSKSADGEKLKRALEPSWDYRLLSNGQEALQYVLDHPQVGLVVTEHRLEGMGGLGLIKELKKHRPSLPLLMVSAAKEAKIAIEAVQAGAYDFLPKPFSPEELREVTSEALSGVVSEESLGEEQTELPGEGAPALVGRSRAMAKLYRDIAKLAAAPFTVLIEGETGSGKELVARALHQYGHRAHKPFLAVNCAAIPENLLESELFGHEKGSFTGATSQKMGKFEQAHGATLFLDEIGDMQPLLQAKMLRVLQEKVVQRVGGKEEIQVDIKIITATHQRLPKMVEEGTFREDLFYRLNHSSLKIPPLRDRLGDTAILAQHFLQLYGRTLGFQPPPLSRQVLSLLERQYWPGNVRQLQNVLRQALLKRRHAQISTTDLKELLERGETRDSVEGLSLRAFIGKTLDSVCEEESGEAYRLVLRQVEGELLSQALQRAKGNQAQAARWLGITRFTLREKLKKTAEGGREGK